MRGDASVVKHTVRLKGNSSDFVKKNGVKESAQTITRKVGWIQATSGNRSIKPIEA